MYDELVKRLREHNGWALNETLDQAADAIEELKQNIEQYKLYLQDAINDLRSAHEKEPKWIPVTERLPEFGARVICKCRANIYEVLTWTVDGWEHDPQHVYMSGFVTHWMPLPEPPKEE